MRPMQLRSIPHRTDELMASRRVCQS